MANNRRVHVSIRQEDSSARGSHSNRGVHPNGDRGGDKPFALPDDMVDRLIKTSGIDKEDDRIELKELIRNAYRRKLGEFPNFKRKLRTLLRLEYFPDTPPDPTPVLTRAKVYSRLVGMALHRSLEEIRGGEDQSSGAEQEGDKGLDQKPLMRWFTRAKQTRSETARLVSLGRQQSGELGDGNGSRPWHEMEINEHLRLQVIPDHSEKYVQHCLMAIEEDDDFMTIIFCDLIRFDKYKVDQFGSCDLSTIKPISKLWLSKFLRHFYFNELIKPIIDKVGLASSKTDINFLVAKLTLCKQLKERGVKAGARLFWWIIKDHSPARKKAVAARKKATVTEGKNNLDKNQNSVRSHDDDADNYSKNESKDESKDDDAGNSKADELFHQVWRGNKRFEEFFLKHEWATLDARHKINKFDVIKNVHENPITVGLRSADTDQAVLCWAARRDYADLIWFVMQAYTPKSKSDSSYDYGTDGLVTETWKYALWCATRHGHTNVIHELSAWNWTGIDINDYSWGWLPPLHLVSLQGHSDMLDPLIQSLHIKLGALNKKDYLGRTPLDYALEFKITTNKFKDFLNNQKPFQGGRGFVTQGHKEVVDKLVTRERNAELYTMYVDQANTVLIGAALIASVTFGAWLQPPLGYTTDSYIAIEGYLTIKLFIVFNTLSFFLAIATMIIGGEATLFVHDKEDRALSLIDMRKSISWMIICFISSMIFIMAAFICAGMAVLPAPVQINLKLYMIISLSVGTSVCAVPLIRMLWSLTQSQTVSDYVTYRFRVTKKSKSGQMDNDLSLIDEDDLRKLIADVELYNVDMQAGLQHIFEEIDKDTDGYIFKEELQDAIKKDGVSQSVTDEEEIIRLFDAADNNRDGKISLDEFVKKMEDWRKEGMPTMMKSLETRAINQKGCRSEDVKSAGDE